MSFIVLYLRHYEKIIISGICLSSQYSFSCLWQKFFFNRGNSYFSKTIQGIKASGLSLFTGSFKRKSGTKNTGTKNGIHCKTSQKPDNRAKEICKEVRCSIKHPFNEHYRCFPQDKIKRWIKNLYRKKSNFNTILTDWHQRNLLMCINSLFLIIYQNKKSRFQINHLYQNKNN